jgi:hypothetical protein
MEPLFEQAKQLSEKIAFYAIRTDKSHVDYSPIRNDLSWGMAYLHAELLFHAKEGPYFAIDDTALKNITEQYILETGKTIDTTKLFAEGLLRQVYQLIKLTRRSLRHLPVSSSHQRAKAGKPVDRGAVAGTSLGLRAKARH